MTVFPIKTNMKDSLISASFGKANYFAFYDGKDVEIVKNQTTDGMALIAWLVESGVESIIIKEIGSNPFKSAQKNNIKVFFCDNTKLTINEVVKKIQNNSFELLNEDQIKTIINKHEKKHSHGKHHKTLKKLIYPTDENQGVKSKLGAHFGKAKYYAVATLNEDKILDVTTIENPGESDGGCVDAISSIMSFSPNALIVNNIASSPARGFLDAGLELYSDTNSQNIEESVKKYIDKTLIKLEI